jgi:hypothetical protein
LHQSDGQAHRQTISPFGNLHSEPQEGYTKISV